MSLFEWTVLVMASLLFVSIVGWAILVIVIYWDDVRRERTKADMCVGEAREEAKKVRRIITRK